MSGIDHYWYYETSWSPGCFPEVFQNHFLLYYLEDPGKTKLATWTLQTGMKISASGDTFSKGMWIEISLQSPSFRNRVKMCPQISRSKHLHGQHATELLRSISLQSNAKNTYLDNPMGIQRTALHCLGISIGHPWDGPGYNIIGTAAPNYIGSCHSCS